MRRNHKNHIGSPLRPVFAFPYEYKIHGRNIREWNNFPWYSGFQRREIHNRIYPRHQNSLQANGNLSIYPFYLVPPPEVKGGFIKGEAIRLLTTNSSKTTFEECLANYKRHLEARRYPKKYLITWNFRDTLISRFWGSHISGQLNFAILRKFCIWLTLISLFWVRHYFFVNFTRHVPGFDQT